MRPIKFRAWSPLAREMYMVNSLHFDRGELFEITVEVREVDGVVYSSAVARNLELMQFTGLHDKNDKEIFEGDIIEIRGTYYDTRREPVIFDMHAFMAGGRFLADFGNYFSLEIIGNIYENPEIIGQ